MCYTFSAEELNSDWKCGGKIKILPSLNKHWNRFFKSWRMCQKSVVFFPWFCLCRMWAVFMYVIWDHQSSTPALSLSLIHMHTHTKKINRFNQLKKKKNMQIQLCKWHHWFIHTKFCWSTCPTLAITILTPGFPTSEALLSACGKRVSISTQENHGFPEVLQNCYLTDFCKIII